MSKRQWYSVKCLFEHPTRRRDPDVPLYEERVLLWQAKSWTEAYEKAEAEAKIYSEEASCVFLKLTDAFELFDDELGEGVEVYSTMRDSNFDAETYADTFCCTGRERMHDYIPESD